MVTMGVFPFQGKTHMVEPGIEPGTSWLVVRRSDHQATPYLEDRIHLHSQEEDKGKSITDSAILNMLC